MSERSYPKTAVEFVQTQLIKAKKDELFKFQKDQTEAIEHYVNFLLTDFFPTYRVRNLKIKKDMIHFKIYPIEDHWDAIFSVKE